MKASAVLDTAREVKNIVSDKTGTLTIDSMMYAWPQRCPQWRDVHRLGPLLLLTTNDSRPNPQYCREAHEQQVHGHIGTHIAVPPHVDARLALCPTLCTTSEEGAIYHSLSQSPAERAKWQACSSGGSDIGSPTPTTLTPRPDASDTLPRGAAAMVSNECSPATLPPPATSVGVQSDEHFHYVVEYESGREARSAVPPVNILAVHASGSVRAVEHVRVLWHYLGGFEPEHVARFSLVSMWRRPAQLGECVWSDVHVRASACDAHLAALGWQRIGTAFLIAQGGGDVVARMCGDAAAAWEAEELRKNPDRTLSHALAELPNLMQVQNDAAQPLRLERGQVLAMHESLKVRCPCPRLHSALVWGARAPRDAMPPAVRCVARAGCRRLHAGVPVQVW
ncbi:hypothetical protein EON67_01725 [archaeon]|nr:MAG: hypothetical protein EON67_01725 [archaeon]